MMLMAMARIIGVNGNKEEEDLNEIKNKVILLEVVRDSIILHYASIEIL